MIDQYNADYTGYAQFSDDEVMRYHLIRCVSPAARKAGLRGVELDIAREIRPGWTCAVFLLLNPSKANAFKNDPTARTCVLFTERWGFDLTWIVNLHAFCSTYPADLKKRAVGFRGDDHQNNVAILTACRSADVVVAAYGNDGGLDFRDAQVRNLLAISNIKLHHLGCTKDGYPKHAQARGVHRIPNDQQPIPWAWS